MELDFVKARALGQKLVLPTFLGIGAQKAGTTWVWQNLKAIDSIYMPRGKELHFFDNKIERSLNRYSKNFTSGAGMIRGEITPAYSVLGVRRIRYVAAALPEVRLVLLIRNPIDRAWSHARMDLERRTGISIEQLEHDVVLEYLRGGPRVRRGMYTHIVDNWTTAYDRDQLLIGLYDDISERPKGLLSRVLRHIGMTEEVNWDQMPWKEVIHGGKPAAMSDRLRHDLSGIYADEIHRCIDRFGAPSSWADAISE